MEAFSNNWTSIWGEDKAPTRFLSASVEEMPRQDMTKETLDVDRKMLQRLAYWWNETLPCRTDAAGGKALMWTHSTDHPSSLFFFPSLYLFDLFLAGVHLCPADSMICLTQKDRQAFIFSLPLLLSISWHQKKKKEIRGFSGRIHICSLPKKKSVYLWEKICFSSTPTGSWDSIKVERGAHLQHSARSLLAKVLDGTATELKWQCSGSFMLPSVEHRFFLCCTC